jgi:ribosomal protein S18 acetylase RimI-like enzyme
MSQIMVRPGKIEDFSNINQFTAEAIYPSFNHPDLTMQQHAENDRIVSITRESCLKSIENKEREVFVAFYDDDLAGFIIADKAADLCPEIDWLIVAPKYQGKGVAQKLMDTALDWLGSDTNVKLGVIHYNQRAIAFYEKYGFKDTGRIAGTHKIPRKLMLREPR